jgi:hypothetical protein
MVSGGLTFVAGIGGIFFPPTLLGTGAIIVGELAGAGTDTYKLAKKLDPTCPAFLASPPPDPYTAGLTAFENHIFPTFPLPGTSDDPYVAAINVVIMAFNQLSADMTTNAPITQFTADLQAEADGMQAMAGQLSIRPQGVLPLSQADFNLGTANIMTSGLPGFETSFLQSAGWSTSDIAGLTAYTRSLNFQLAVPSITPAALTFELAAEIAVPEPSTFFTIFAGILAWCTIRKHVALVR